MRRRDLLAQLARVADEVGPLAAPPGARAQLEALCATVRVAFSAAACSVARLDDTVLVYEAAAGAGAAGVVGVRLPLTRGVAGYVARTGQALAIEQVANDPRFARDVAERTGYVPSSLLVVPVVDAAGGVLGVLSVLDRGAEHPAPLAVATAAAAQAAAWLPAIDAVVHLGPLLLASLAAAVAAEERDLAAALRREADRLAVAVDPDDLDDTDASLVRVAVLLAEVRAAGPATAQAAERILGELVALGRRGRR